MYTKYEFLYPETFPEMLKLYEVLKKKSAARGSLELETTEAGIVLDENGLPVDIIPRERGVAEKLIEQFMLCANEGVATWLNSLGMPCFSRIHEDPMPAKVRDLAFTSRQKKRASTEFST